MTARRVTLTFDNGPTPGVTERVLEILAGFGIPATFFVIGSKIDKSTAGLMQQAHAAGHWIGNHTLSHSVALGDRPERGYAVREIEMNIGHQFDPVAAETFLRLIANGRVEIGGLELVTQSPVEAVTYAPVRA